MRFIVTQEEKLKERRASPEHIADDVQDITNNNVQDVLNSPVRGQHSLYEPDEVDGGSSVAHDLQVMNDARLPQYDRDSTMDTYIQSYLEVGLLLLGLSYGLFIRAHFAGTRWELRWFWCIEISHASWLLLLVIYYYSVHLSHDSSSF